MLIKYLLVFFTIILSKSLYYESFGANNLIVIYFLILLSYFVFKVRLIYKPPIIIIVLITFWMIISQSGSLNTNGMIIILLLISSMITQIITIKEFAECFLKIILVLSLLSFLRYPILLFNIETFLIDFTSLILHPYSNYLFFAIKEDTIFFDQFRNNGLWYEPGAFQIFINLAYLFGVIFKIIKPKQILLLLLTVLSTFSTAGILVFGLISIAALDFKRIKYFIPLLIMVLTILNAEIFYEVLVLKMDLNNASTGSRFRDLMFNFKVFANHPINGIGFGESDLFFYYTKNLPFGTGSNTIGTILMSMGFFSFLILAPLLLLTPIKINLSKKILYITTIFLLFITQNFSLVLIFWILFIYNVRRLKFNI